MQVPYAAFDARNNIHVRREARSQPGGESVDKVTEPNPLVAVVFDDDTLKEYLVTNEYSYASIMGLTSGLAWMTRRLSKLAVKPPGQRVSYLQQTSKNAPVLKSVTSTPS
jgi:hypothetical protein